eukprot:jgi/Undpi1/8669/HiC_scaffold_25.g11134.m1
MVPAERGPSPESRHVSTHKGRTKHPSTAQHGSGSASARAQARAAEKTKVAAARQELLVGLSAEGKREMTSFMGSVNAKTRDILQEVVGMISASGHDPRLLQKKVLVHALAHLDVDRWDLRINSEPRETVALVADPYAGGVGKVDEILEMAEEDKKALALQLADWDTTRRSKVMRAWESADPAMTAEFLLARIREEQARGDGAGNLWQCSVCPIKRKVERETRMMRQGRLQQHDRAECTATLLGYNDEGPGGSNIYSSPHESLFRLWSQSSNTSDGATEERDGSKAKGKHNQTENTGNYDNNGGDSDASVLASWNRSLPRPSDKQDRRTSAIEASTSSDNDSDPRRPQLMLTYAGMGFDSRRMCGPCTVELRRAVISSGHDLELWHTVDHERRGLLTGQRRGDVFKAQWAEHEQQERQVSELLQFICEANLNAFSRHSLEERERTRRDIQAAEVRRTLDLKLSNASAVKAGSGKDVALKRSNEREATAWASTLKLKACLNMDRHYGSLEKGGLPASLRRRHKTSTRRSDFLPDGTPATPQGAMQTFGRAGLPDLDESRELQLWKDGATETEELFDRRREVRQWQSSCGRRARFSHLCGRWVDAAVDIEEKQRQKLMMEAADRERRAKERLAAKLRRKLQLADLRAKAGSRATGEAKRRVERDKETEERRRWESEELERMKREEAKQLAGGDRYWGLVRELQRLRVIEAERRLAWEARIRATRDKMVAIRCISDLSDFTHAIPPEDPELAQKIAKLTAM